MIEEKMRQRSTPALMWRSLRALPAVVALGVLLVLSSGPADAATTFVVNRTGDAADLDGTDGVCDASRRSGVQCTLRAAIEEADATPGGNSIDFGIGGRATAKTINVGGTGLGPLPIINEPVTIDGYTQRGARANTLAKGNDAVLKIVLNGASAGTDASGLEVQAQGSIVRGLVIKSFSAHGVIIRGSGATDNQVEGNFIGTNARGTRDRGNGGGGVVIAFAPGNTIGGTQPAQRNLISGNSEGFGGVHITGGGARGNTVEGNYIGTNARGTARLGNSGDGVLISNVPGNTVGGTASGARNVISANENGVRITGDGASGNEVLGNYIGTTADGTGDLGNRLDGVVINGAPDNTVGGTVAAARNTISGNGDDGVVIFSPLSSVATGNRVEGNRIGIEADGSGALGNDGDGVIISGAPDNSIGGTTSGAGNAIANNGGTGVSISSGTGNGVLSNLIFSNGGLGIDLAGGTEDSFGVTDNDTDDPDTGANDLQNFPVITAAIRSTTVNPGLTTITGTLNSNPSQTYTVQCFLAAPDPSGNGEGQVLVAQDTVTTNLGGNADGTEGFSCVSPILQVGQAITVTATNTATGDTSEFSENQAVAAGP